MTNKLYFEIITTIFILTLTCKSNGQEVVTNKITFLQDDSSFVITKSSGSILLDRKPFRIRYFGKQYDDKNEKFYSAQIAILENPGDTFQLRLGQLTKDISYFEPGTGMAPGENGMYETIYITNTGHHYLTYESENDKRADLISKSGDKLELEWKISAAFYQDKDVQFSELKLSSLYFIIFIDDDLNRIIDKDELRIVNAIFR